MNCPSCQAENSDNAKFCSNCGTALLQACPQCGAEQPAGANFCNNCGHKLNEAATKPTRQHAPAGSGALERFIPRGLLHKLESARTAGQMVGERRVVTMLFCDVSGSTAAAARFDPEEWAEIMNGAFEQMIGPIYQYEGTVARLMGDGLLAFFGAPIAHEDDPQRAVLAGLQIIQHIDPYSEQMKRQWGVDIAVRVGVNTGLVVVGAVGSDLRMEYSALGDAINLAARMEQTTPPGTVQIAEPTYRLVAPLFEFDVIDGLEVKGIAEPVRAYRVLGQKTTPGSLRGIAGMASPLVGRDSEMTQLAAAFDSLRAGQGGIVGVMGEAGLGKSRLIAEVRQTMNSAPIRWLEGKSQSYQTTTPYAPFVNLLAASAGLPAGAKDPAQYIHLREQVERYLPGRGDELVPFLAQPLGLPIIDKDAELVQFLEPPVLRGRVFEAIVAWIEALAAEQPTVLYLDDVHWIDPTSLDLLRALLPTVERMPLMILLAFRPRREDPSWHFHETTGQSYPQWYTTIVLRPLDQAQGRALVGNLLAIEDLPESIRGLILEKAEGNPFFLEEIIRSLLDAGLVEQQNGHWRATADIIEVQIPDTLTGVITARLDRLGDVDKQVLQAASVLGRDFDFDTLADLLDGSLRLEDHLTTLRQRELILPLAAGHYTFKHGLTQEAAYESLLLSRRRQLHHLAADIIRNREPERAAEIARHFLEARQPAQAIPYLVEAGHQAARTFAAPEASGYYNQALGLELLGETRTIRAAYEGLGGLYMMSDPAQALSTFEKMLAAAETRDDKPMMVSALNKISSILALMMGRFDEAGIYLDRAERLAESEKDIDGFAEMSIVRCQMCTLEADFDSVIRYMDGVVGSSLETGNDHNLVLALGHTTTSLLWLGRFDEAWEKAQETLTLARQMGDRPHEAEIMTIALPPIHVRNGNLDLALETAQEGIRIARRIDAVFCIATGEWRAAEIYRARGEYEATLAAAQRSLDAAMPLESFLPFLMVHPLGTLGSTYLEISPRFTDKIAEFHRYALHLLELPAGAMGGGNAWADLGWCAMTLGDVELADQMFEKGLTYPTIMMRVERPRYLAGAALIRLKRGDVAGARLLAEEACAFVREHGMKNWEPLVHLTLGRILATENRHEAALIQYEQAEQSARAMRLRPVLQQIQAASARSLAALGRSAEAGRAASEATGTTQAIANLFEDEQLRSAYLEGAAMILTGETDHQ